MDHSKSGIVSPEFYYFFTAAFILLILIDKSRFCNWNLHDYE